MQSTIEALRLDVRRLEIARKAAIFAEIESIDNTAEAWAERIVQLSLPDAEGRLSPFCFAVQSVLRLYADPPRGDQGHTAG